MRLGRLIVARKDSEGVDGCYVLSPGVSASMSARSFGRPAARLFRRNTSRPRKATVCWPKEPVTRSVAASSHVTPLMLLMRWICTGGTPNVEVAREPRSAVKRERIRAHDHELSPMGNQGADKLVEIWREIHRPAGAGTPPRLSALPTDAIANSADPNVHGAPLRTTSAGPPCAAA